MELKTQGAMIWGMSDCKHSLKIPFCFYESLILVCD